MRLTVRPLKNREPGSGIAVVDRAALEHSALSSGDFLRIDRPSSGTALARVWPSDTEDVGRGIVRIDGQLRQAAGDDVDIGDLAEGD